MTDAQREEKKKQRREYMRRYRIAGPQRKPMPTEERKKRRRESTARYRANHPERLQAYRQQSKVQQRARWKVYYYQNQEKESQKKKRRRQWLREAVYEIYGRRCACPGCTETNIHLLTLDHVANDGASHRKQGGGSTIVIQNQVINHPEVRSRFRLLCFNCNCARQFRGEGACHPLDKIFLGTY